MLYRYVYISSFVSDMMDYILGEVAYTPTANVSQEVNSMQRFFVLLLLCAAWGAAASPYDSLTYALNQQTLVKDLRAQCEIKPSVSDEQVKKVFINSEVNHNALSAAAAALKEGKQAQYQQLLNTVRCPGFNSY
jgi:hypothetical protein